MKIRPLVALAALASLLGGAPATAAAGASPVTKQAQQEQRRVGRRALRDLLVLGGITPAGNPVGYGWIYRRTKNFRRKGVGHRWKVTLRNGKRPVK